ncbi:MAG: hypothetical protein ABIL66_02615 [candidate division WOR-3 bacterium]
MPLHILTVAIQNVAENPPISPFEKGGIEKGKRRGLKINYDLLTPQPDLYIIQYGRSEEMASGKIIIEGG